MTRRAARHREGCADPDVLGLELHGFVQLLQTPLPRGRIRRKCAEVGKRGLRHVIPEPKDQREQQQAKGYRGGRPPRFDRAVYRLRDWAERRVNRLNSGGR